MTLQVLFIHWKAVRWALVPFVIAAFALPLLSVQAVPLAVRSSGPYAASMLAAAQTWGALFPLIAGALGALLALSAWGWDHRLGHVYALALPVSRERYALLKFGAGAVLALLPGAALLAGSLAASAGLELPEGLRTYPVLLASRFLFATLVVYAVFFALAAGTLRTGLIVIGVVVGAPLVVSFSLDFAGAFIPRLAEMDVGLWMEVALARGPFRVFFGSWSLVDV